MQSQRRKNQQAMLNSATVVKEFIVAVVTKKKKSNKGTLAEYCAKNGQLMLSVNRQGNSDLILRVTPKSGATKQEILNACQQAIDKYF